MKKTFVLSLCFALALIFCCFTRGASAGDRAENAYKTALERADAGVQTLEGWYNSRTGLWRGMGWWNSANALTCIIRFGMISGDDVDFELIDNTFRRAGSQHMGNFRNEFYDDEAWWGLAWLEAYELTKKREYLDMAVLIFEDITGAFSEQFGGGMHWKRNDPYKNSITNNLFVLLALRLHANGVEKKVREKTPVEWAEKIWKWYRESGMINTENWMIEDGLRRENGQPNRNQHWTYNQGVAIAVFCEWYKLEKNEEDREIALKLAKATMERLSRNGILRERNEPRPGADGTQFKGIFMRHLLVLYEVSKNKEVRDFVQKNSDSIWENRNKENNMMGVVWNEPTAYTNSAAHSSALDALVCRLGIEKIDMQAGSN